MMITKQVTKETRECFGLVPYRYTVKSYEYNGQMAVTEIDELKDRLSGMYVPSLATAIVAMNASDNYISTVRVDGDSKHPHTTVRGVLASSKRTENSINVSIRLVEATPVLSNYWPFGHDTDEILKLGERICQGGLDIGDSEAQSVSVLILAL